MVTLAQLDEEVARVRVNNTATEAKAAELRRQEQLSDRFATVAVRERRAGAACHLIDLIVFGGL